MSTPSGGKGELPRARLLTSATAFEMLREKEMKKQEEAEMKEKKREEMKKREGRRAKKKGRAASER